jgi:hypothetical protein
MSGYAVSLFLHLVGVVCLFTATVMMHFVGTRLRRAATVQEVRMWLGFARSSQPLFPIGGVLLLLTGLHLAGAGWDFRQPWIIVGLVIVILLLPAGPLLQRPRFMAMGMAAGSAEPGPVPVALSSAVMNPFVWKLLSASTGAAIGLLWIMTQKPAGWLGALLPPLALALVGWLYGASLLQRDSRAAGSGEAAVASAKR